MPLFSSGAESLLRSSGTISPTYTPEPGIRQRKELDRSITRGISAGLGLAEQAITRDTALKENTYLIASGVAQSRFDHDLKRELGKFYTSDGRDITPDSEYSKDLGFGVSLVAGDFIDKGGSGQRRSYVEMVKHMQDKFIESRIQVAPTDRADTRVRPRLDQGKLFSEVQAFKYADARRQIVVANSLNDVVRAYKEELAQSRGYDPMTFGLHVNALLETSQADPEMDPGMGRNAALAALGDLIAVGVTESHTDRDNAFALEVLAASPIRNTEMVNKAVSGLSFEDQTYLKKQAYLSRRRKKLYKRGEALPGNNVSSF